MGKKIVILGSSDTKKDQLKFLREKIIQRGHEPIFMDMAMGGPARLASEVTPFEIATAGGNRLEDLLVSKDRYFVTNVMT